MTGINEGVKYLKSVPSVLKILEIILQLGCVGSVGYFWDNWAAKDNDDVHVKDNDNVLKNDYIKVFLWSAAASGVTTLLFFLIFLIGLHKKIKVLNWSKIGAAIFVLLAILLFAASGLLADTLMYYKDKKICKGLETLDTDSQCTQLTAGTVCGFFAGVILLVDGIIHFKM